MKTLKYTLTMTKTGETIVDGRTEKRAVALVKIWGGECTVTGADGAIYARRGTRLVTAEYIAPPMTERELAACVADMTRRPLRDGNGDDAEAIENLGLGTVDGGRFSRGAL